MEHGQIKLWLNQNYYQSILTKLVESALWKSERPNILKWCVWDGWPGISFLCNFPTLIVLFLLLHVWVLSKLHRWSQMYEVILKIYMDWNGESEEKGLDAEGVKI